jgi:hypothetical protein
LLLKNWVPDYLPRDYKAGMFVKDITLVTPLESHHTFLQVALSRSFPLLNSRGFCDNGKKVDGKKVNDKADLRQEALTTSICSP